ncbi:MAG: hypothetical protein KatS3mg065_0824 [Chloroflexota bacterium]|nr:MAG: hypothetical protein KatS3mg065_0824 [Chloroflexota bacterium]
MFTATISLPERSPNGRSATRLRSRRTRRDRRLCARFVALGRLLITVASIAVGTAVTIAACSPGGDISVRDPWIRLTDPSRPLGGFMTIVNAGPTDDAVIAAESPAFGSIELHETAPMASGESPTPVDHGMASPMPSDHGMMSPTPSGSGMAMTMRPVAEIPIPAGGEQVLQPGGYHLMLMDPKGSLTVGDSVELTLRFKSGRSLTLEVPLRAP